MTPRRVNPVRKSLIWGIHRRKKSATLVRLRVRDRGGVMADQNITLGGVLRSDVLDEADFEELRANFRGELLRSRDDGYDAARAVFNGMIDRRPAVIARCAGVADVIAAVNFAREHDVQVAVRGGDTRFLATRWCTGASSWTSRR